MSTQLLLQPTEFTQRNLHTNHAHDPLSRFTQKNSPKQVTSDDNLFSLVPPPEMDNTKTKLETEQPTHILKSQTKSTTNKDFCSNSIQNIQIVYTKQRITEKIECRPFGFLTISVFCLSKLFSFLNLLK